MTPTTSIATYDVVVVGARVAGAATAMLLARRGLSVLVLDRRDPATDTVSTHALMRGAVVQLGRWGLLDAVATGTAPIERVTFHYGDEQESVDLRSRGGALYAPRRTLLDPLLVASARAAAPVLRRGVGATAVAYRYTSSIAPDGYQWRYRPGVAAGLIPTGGGLICAWAGTTTARFRAERHVGLERWFATTLTDAAPDVAPQVLDDDTSRLRGWAGPPGFLRRAFGQGWVLVGDAGSFTDPISAHGITDALRDAELACAAVVTALSDPSAEHEAFADYQAQRDEVLLPVLLAADAVAATEDDLVARRAHLLTLSVAMRAEATFLRVRGAAPGAGVAA